MQTTVFEWREDREFGGEGWILKGFPDFNASQGIGIAHDTLEHFAGGDGSLSHEMLAFGSMLYMRGESGWFHQYGNARGAADNMGSDIARFLDEMSYQDMGLRNPGRTYALRDGLEDDLQAILTKGLSDANENARYNGSEVATVFTRDYKIEWMAGWMRRGYRMCKKRWPGASASDMSWLFRQIQRDIDRRFKEGNHYEELHVRVNPTTREFQINRRYQDE